MCGRYLLTVGFDELMRRYGINDSDMDFSPREEVFPSNTVPVILNQGKKEFKEMNWGFAPSFTKRLLINARSETVAIKPTFKSSFIKRRCIIPANGFYEWEKSVGKSIKHKIYLESKDIFSMAGIYNTFIDKEGNTFEAFTILTTSANGKMKRIHDRMPAIIDKEDEDLWLDNSIPDLDSLENIIKSSNSSIIIA